MLNKISDSEYEVMEVIWKQIDWVTIGEVHEKLSNAKPRAYKTVATFIVRLCDKNMLQTKKQGKVNVYRSNISRQEYISEQTKSFLQQIHNGSKRSLIAALYDGSVSNDKIDELLKGLEE